MLKRIFAAFLAAWVGVAFASDKPLNAVSGTITTQNLVAGGDATAGSAVEIDVTGIASVTVQVTGTYTAAGGLVAQVTADRRTWVTECSSSCTSTFTRRTTGVASAAITSGQEDVYQVQFANGAKRLRITALGAVTGTAVITLHPSDVGGSSAAAAAGGGDASAANQTAVQAPVTAGAATATKSVLIGGQFNTADPTFTNGQQGTLRANVNGLLKTESTAVASTTGTQTSVADTNADTTCLAANSARIMAMVYNDSTAVLYLLLSNATSSATAHTVQLAAGAYYELPARYTGVIKCIWASDASGSARVTEITP